MALTASKLRASIVIFLALTPRALAADGVDFSNNLFSDLAPVLALFGEQVSKQFLSQSLTWLEDVIFAMAPLGIVTAIVSAVRAGGPGWLKAVVGRARESRAVAEVELMSSTSHEVCELWNGEAIVRVMGSTKFAEILYFQDGADGKGGSKFFTLEAAKENGILINAKKRREDRPTHGEGTVFAGLGLPDRILSTFRGPFVRLDPEGAYTRNATAGREYELRRRHQRAAPTHATPTRDTDPISTPNISLNICGARGQGELWVFAILGIVLQFGCLIFIGVTRYHPKLNWKEEKNSKYAYPLMASGTLLLVVGMMACSRVVQASSEEDIWVSKRSFRILWLQKGDRVNDQLFKSYALFGDKEREELVTSRRRPHSSPRTSSRTKHVIDVILSLSTLTIAGAFIGIAGFVVQFVGIRALHWSASIAQLVVTLTMTTVRTWIRRKMSKRPKAMKLPVDDEIDWVAVRIGASQDALWKPKPNGPEGARDSDPTWEVITLHGYLGYKGAYAGHIAPIGEAQAILGLRKDLGDLMSWDEISYSFASKLVECLQSLLFYFIDSGEIALAKTVTRPAVLHWALPVKVGGTVQYITMTASRGSSFQWNVDTSELCAVISLWCYGVKSKDIQNTYKYWSYRADPETVLRVLGPATHRFVSDCERWMDRGGRFAVVENARLWENTIEGRATEVNAQELSKIITRVRDHTDHTTDPSPPTDDIAPYRITGTKPINIDGCYKSLAFVSTAPLKQMCAQEILSSLLWAIVGIVGSVPDDTQSRSATPSGDHESEVDEQPDPTPENPFLQELAEIITNSGVTSNIQDAYALIIPPFAAADKLPRRPSDGFTQDEIESIRPQPTSDTNLPSL
ncbi:unnamed protein product [Tuber melanosporum]|uniref:(Perigord truffle) hypothetical protein n=1 Tax=Tuber melanosporum (strain Mel28) TaxID=656061 RepID=D5GNK9_TUBMM|nr:uncharacterized protein GSTUM_00011339001 [Tuber melanosporum]CAZ86102.1 unnamed protein product [Tuber melanosporum]